MNKEFANCVQMKELDMSRLEGKTFYCIIAPHTGHSCCETTYQGDFATHTHIDAEGNFQKRQGKILLSDATCEEDRSVVIDYENNRFEFKVIDTDYETFIIKVTEMGTYLCMNVPEPAEEKIMSFNVKGERVCQNCEKCNWRKANPTSND